MQKIWICALIASALMLSVNYPSLGADEKGVFMMGGGVGGVSCPEFLNAMATARQQGGADRSPGVNKVGGFAMYVLGFQTGFNSEAEGVYDIFTSLGSDPALKALYSIEPWCASHPDRKFSDAVIALANALRSKD